MDDSQVTAATEEEGRERQTCLNCQILPAAPRAGGTVSPGPPGLCHPYSASQSLPAPTFSFSHCFNFFVFFFLHLTLSCSPSPPLLCCSASLFSFSLCTSVLSHPSFFLILCLCPAAHHYFVFLHLSVCLLIPIFLIPPCLPFSPSQFPLLSPV